MLQDPDGRNVFVRQTKSTSVVQRLSLAVRTRARDAISENIEAYVDDAGAFRIGHRDANGKVIASSRQTYESKAAAERSIQSLKIAARTALFLDFVAEIFPGRKK